MEHKWHPVTGECFYCGRFPHESSNGEKTCIPIEGEAAPSSSDEKEQRDAFLKAEYRRFQEASDAAIARAEAAETALKEARRRLEKGRSSWNGPVLEAVWIIDRALGKENSDA